jgi:flavodoxin
MKPIVLYATKSGNTKKVADAIASELNCETFRITQTSMPKINLNYYDVIFIGSGISFGNPNEDLVRFLQAVELKEQKRFTVFLTWGGAGQTDKQALNRLQTLLESKGQTLVADSFKCFGGRQFTFAKRGHPNGDDLRASSEWAKKIVTDSH